MGATLCRLYPFFFYGNVGASLMNMVAITINRYVVTSDTSFAAFMKPFTLILIRLGISPVDCLLFCRKIVHCCPPSFAPLLPPHCQQNVRLKAPNGINEVLLVYCTLIRKKLNFPHIYKENSEGFGCKVT
jgi:hypothetical protein